MCLHSLLPGEAGKLLCPCSAIKKDINLSVNPMDIKCNTGRAMHGGFMAGD